MSQITRACNKMQKKINSWLKIDSSALQPSKCSLCSNFKVHRQRLFIFTLVTSFDCRIFTEQNQDEDRHDNELKFECHIYTTISQLA